MRTWIERQRYLIDFTIASLGRRRGRNLGLLVVYTAIIFVLASAMLFSHAIRHEAAMVLEGAPEVVVQRMVAGRHDLIPASTIEQLGEIRGTRDVRGRLWGYFFDPTVSANYTMMVPDDRELKPGEIVIGTGIMRARGAAPGDILAIRAYDGTLFSLTVAGTLDSRSELVSADLMLVSEHDFRGFFGIPAGQFTDAVLRVRNPREVRNVAQKIAQGFPDTRPILREEILRTYDSVFSWREGILLVLLSGALLAFAIFAWDKASGLSAEEKREVGVLKAIGWETSDVLLMKFWEGGLVSATAFLLGYVLAYVQIFHFDAPLFAPVLKGWAVLYPSFALTPQIDGFQVATLFFFTVFPYTVATIIPIWRAAIIDPDTVMR